MYQDWFTNCNKCTTLCKMLVIGETAQGEKGCVGTLYLLLNFFCNPKTILNNKVY